MNLYIRTFTFRGGCYNFSGQFSGFGLIPPFLILISFASEKIQKRSYKSKFLRKK